MDYRAHAKSYYKIIERNTVRKFGAHATTYDAKTMMNHFGNLLFFSWFPDIFPTDKERLQELWRPTFSLVGRSKYADFLHGLTHIRSRSEHTNMGESVLVPDNLYALGIRYSNYFNINRDKRLEECSLSPFDQFELGNEPISYKKLFLLNVRFDAYKYQDKNMVLYEKSYLEGMFKKDFPNEKPSEKFLTHPLNAFEKRLSKNVVRAIYMDEKFKWYGSSKKSFIHTPVSTSIKEPYFIIFSNKEEDQWIEKISAALYRSNTNSKLGEIFNTTNTKDSIPQQIAKNTIKELRYFLQ